MSDYGDWARELREESQRRNAKRLEENTAKVKALAEKYGLELHWFTPYHVRISGEVGQLDYYPTSGKVASRGYIDGNSKWVKEFFTYANAAKKGNQSK